MSGQKKVGCPLGSQNSRRLKSLSPDVLNKQFGNLRIVSEEIVRKGRFRPFVLAECIECGKKEWKCYHSVQKCTAGCRKCGRKRNSAKPCLGVPRWLLMRCISAKERCTNRKCPEWKNYGARGITFEFKSPSEMGLYLMQNCSIQRNLEIDRIDNDKGYAPGNLRAVSRRINANNRRGRRGTSRMHKFKLMHPNVRYADSTLIHLLSRMTFKEVVDRYQKKSDKPKGVFGTYSTPDPEIASLAKGC